MIKSKKRFQLAIGLLLIGVFSGILFDALVYFPHATAYLLSIPIASHDTEFLLGWIVIGVTIAGLVLLPLSLRRHHVITTFVCLVAIIVTPHIM
ncbi:hypothetical protein [Exiguobacterium sp. 9-2]|uniref:hypothetical protein n=1 Tax=Exiguobacterium sp. 9-2 TaxID=3112419 RepID=UPI002E2FF228|nr:hypothetical protein [Exiguobacterium sp. 9-2]